uniref:Uncharacterized protein n=1 Tax=Panagrolaimus superbus TaxID=310955 RepID=A0A914YE94_9BILA
MAEFVECDLGETLQENESIDIFNDEPPAKKKRGPNLKYIYVEEAESFEDLKEKAKNAGLTIKDTPASTFYAQCKISKCGYKWKATKTDDFKYLIYETECEHDHGNVVKKAGLTKKMKDIVYERMKGNERVNAGAVIQAFLNAVIRKES